MTTGAQVQLGIRTGFATATTCKIVVASLADGDVTITGSWGTTTITAANMAALGATPVCYVGSATISGLSAFTRYSYTATQGAKTASGSFMTAPGVRDDFSLFFVGCDKNGVYANWNPTGFWDQIHDYAVNGALPTVGMLFVDDHGYVDTAVVDDSAGTGLAVSDLTNGPAYTALLDDYAIAYLANLGMLADAADTYVAWGRDTERAWCNQNINYIPQWGDHEFINDFGFDYNNTTATALSVGGATGVQVWAAGKAAWDALFKPLYPTLLNEANGYGWAASLGCVNLIAPDGITNANGTWDRATLGALSGEPTVLFGTAQIDDILTWVAANPQPFNLFGMAHSIRYLEDTSGGVTSVYNMGAQHPLYDHILPEYQQLFTASGNTPSSLMEGNASNGVAGATILLHGDYHHACVLHHAKAAYAGNLAENLYSIHLGTINGSTNFTMPLAEGSSYGGTTLEYTSGWVNTSGSNHQYAGMRIDVYGSYSRPELHITLIDSTGATMWAGKWLARSSNEALDTNYKVPQAIGTSRKATKI